MKYSAKISYNLAIVLYLQIASICCAPMQMQMLPMQYGMQPHLPFIRHTPNIQAPVPPMYQQQPLMLVIPNGGPNTENENKYVNLNEPNDTNNLRRNTGHIDESKEAVVIDANPKSPETETKNALVYLPEEGRFSIGQIISYIPFLPVEVNVPDTISWISNILTGGWFRPQAPTGAVKRLPNNGPVMIVLPYPGSVPQV